MARMSILAQWQIDKNTALLLKRLDDGDNLLPIGAPARFCEPAYEHTWSGSVAIVEGGMQRLLPSQMCIHLTASCRHLKSFFLFRYPDNEINIDAEALIHFTSSARSIIIYRSRDGNCRSA